MFGFSVLESSRPSDLKRCPTKNTTLFPPSFFFVQGPGKIPWGLEDVKEMACNIKQGLPLAVAQVLSAPEWKGGSLVQLEDTFSTPKAEDIVLNQPWIFPFIKKFRDAVPSQFFAADVVLYLDQLYSGTLLVPMEEGDSKVSLAVSESKKIKLLIGALRALWRSSTLFNLGLLFFCIGIFLYTFSDFLIVA